MRFLRLFLISIVVLFLVITAISLFIPSHIHISRAVYIKADRDKIMAQVSDPLQWKNWYPGMDSAQLIYEGGIPSGAILPGPKTASLTIIKKEADEVTASFAGTKMRPVVNGWKTIGSTGADSITLQWYMDFHLRWYPWEKFASLLLEKSYGTRMEQGLSNLKKKVEN